MPVKSSRRTFVSTAALLLTATASSVLAQFGGRSRDRSDANGTRSQRSGDSSQRPTLLDPAAAIERELPSLRIDLKLTADQTPLFDSFERQVRNTAEAGRAMARHLFAFRNDDGSTVTADKVLNTIADEDAQRADAARLALEKMTALYAALTADQQKQFDRRIIQALREPLGNS
jgi:hypothetical protein